MTGHITLNRCWSCMTGSHFDFNNPVPHTWMDDEDDFIAAKAAGQDIPKDLITERPCACECGGGPGPHVPLDYFKETP